MSPADPDRPGADRPGAGRPGPDRPSADDPDADRRSTGGGGAVGFGQELMLVHQHLRDRLTRLRADPTAGSEPSFPQHCLAFCSMLTGHHRIEDAAVFPAVAAEHPELRDVLEELSREHHVIHDIVERIEQLTGSGRPVGEIRGELDGLAAICESHFAWEERRLVDALDAMSA